MMRYMVAVLVVAVILVVLGMDVVEGKGRLTEGIVYGKRSIPAGGYSSPSEPGVHRRQRSESNVRLSLEWSKRGQLMTEPDYLVLPSADNDTADALRRPGQSTNAHTCNIVRSVPGHLRSAIHMRPRGLSTFYQKYTEAYGIPVLSSRDVSDSALSRACYVLRFLLADHAGVRQSYYRLSGRVAVIGAQEGTVSIPEHAGLGSFWNSRTRGLGATEHAPVSTGGEENILCYSNDSFPDMDILLHALSHGVHRLGAKHAIPGWQRRLETLYSQTRSSGRWANTYAMNTVEDYFAEGTESYFNVNGYAPIPDGIHGPINTHEKLRLYDPKLYALIQEVFPCNNNYIKRCAKTRGKELNQALRMDCPAGGNGQEGGKGGTDTASSETEASERTNEMCLDNSVHCASWASLGECSKNPHYMSVNCRQSCNKCVETGEAACVDSNSNCGSWAQSGYCTSNAAYMATNCRKSCNQC